MQNQRLIQQMHTFGIQVISPKIVAKKHRANLSQPQINNSSSFNSFNEYFRSHHTQQRTSRNYRSIISDSKCKTESRLLMDFSNSTKRMSIQSSTLCLSNTKSQSTSPKTIVQIQSQKKVKQQTKNHAQKYIYCKDFKKQLDSLLKKTKTLIKSFQEKENMLLTREKELTQEIIKLKARIELQNRLLIKYNIPIKQF